MTRTVSTSTAEAVARYYDAWAPTYDAVYQSRPETSLENQTLLHLLRSWEPGLSTPDAENGAPGIIDVGCGTGWLLDQMPRVRGRYLGFDVSRGMLEQARRKHPDCRPQLVRHDALEAPWPRPTVWDSPHPRRGWVAVALWAVPNYLDPGRFLAVFMATDWVSRIALVANTTGTPSPPSVALPDHPHPAKPFNRGDWFQAIQRFPVETTSCVGLQIGGSFAPVARSDYVWWTIRKLT